MKPCLQSLDERKRIEPKANLLDITDRQIPRRQDSTWLCGCPLGVRRAGQTGCVAISAGRCARQWTCGTLRTRYVKTPTEAHGALRGATRNTFLGQQSRGQTFRTLTVERMHSAGKRHRDTRQCKQWDTQQGSSGQVKELACQSVPLQLKL